MEGPAVSFPRHQALLLIKAQMAICLVMNWQPALVRSDSTPIFSTNYIAKTSSLPLFGQLWLRVAHNVVLGRGMGNYVSPGGTAECYPGRTRPRLFRPLRYVSPTDDSMPDPGRRLRI